MSGERLRLVGYSLGHFWVDFSCALLMFSCLWGRPEWTICVLLYNFCAFAMQMPIGLAADRLDRNSAVAAVGCALAVLGWCAVSAPVLAAVMAGLGNACFHVGGGIDVLNFSRTKSAALGVFVSPGAFGIYFGTILGKSNGVPHWLSMMGLAVFALAFVVMDLRLRGSLCSGNSKLNIEYSWNMIWALTCCFFVVALRSYIGMILSFPWKSGGWALAAICAVVLGKAAGGFLGDKLGMSRAAGWSLGLAAVLFCFSGYPAAGVAAVFLFNMTMPITLWAAAKLMPGAKGFAFGMLTFALFLGFLPVCLGWGVPAGGGVGYALGALASLLILLIGLKKGKL